MEERFLAGSNRGPCHRQFDRDFRSVDARWKLRGVRREAAFAMNWTQQAKKIHREAYVFYFAFKHPRMPWFARLVAAVTAGYLLSPVQLIPSFIPVIGLLDDVLVLYLGVKLLRRITPPDVLAECRTRAHASEMQNEEEIRSFPSAVAVWVIVGVIGLLTTAALSALVAAYAHH